MLNVFKFLIVTTISIFILAGVSPGQTEDEQIRRLERQIQELKKQKIKKLEEEKKKLEAEVLGSPASDAIPVAPIPGAPAGLVMTGAPPPGGTPPARGDSAPGSLPRGFTADVATPATAVAPPGLAAAPLNCVVSNIDSLEATRLQRAICRLRDRILQESSNNLSPNRVGQQLMSVLAAKFAKSDTEKAFFLESERKRTDKQVGAAPNAAGTTALAVKGGMPEVIGWAVEQGAATSSVNGNTVTVRVNPYNLGKTLFYNQGILDLKLSEGKEDVFGAFLKRVALGFSFDTSSGTDAPIFVGSKKQLSAFSFRYEFINHRNPLSPRYNKARLDFFDSQKGNQDKVAWAIRDLIDARTDRMQNGLLQKWVDDTNAMLSALPTDLDAASREGRVQEVLESRMDSLPIEEISENEEIVAAVRNFTEGSIGFKKARDEFIESVDQGTVATFEYTNNRKVNAPDTSNFRFIWEKGIFRSADFTFNAAVTIYNKRPAMVGVSRVKDFDFTAQVDVPLKNTLLGESFLSFSGKYLRQPSEVILPNGVVAEGSKGDIAFAQVKFTIPIRDTGIRLPLSLTFANRTEFVKENMIRAGFGFTFDLDPLFGRFKPFQ